MLPPFIIDQIRRREEQEKIQRDAPHQELPLPNDPLPQKQKTHDDDEPKRGVVIIDLG
ncbi:MAG: hypothetical protein AB7P00_04690 [Sandaracinaceae bacterium]